MLEKAYDKPDSKKTSEIYRELSLRTGVEQKKLKTIFAAFYDIIAESIINDMVKDISFDKAFYFRTRYTPEKIEKKDNGNIEITPEKINITVKLGSKIKYRVIDLFNEKNKYP